MRAVFFEEFGGRDVLQVGERPEPQAGPGEVRIRVEAAGVNPVDWKMRQGYLKDRIPHEFPVIPGWDAAGTVDQVGDGVDAFAAGDPVYAYCRKDTVHGGCYAQYVTVLAEHVARRPGNISVQEAAAVPLVGLTAWQSLFDAAGLRGTEHILIHAGAGGVGHLAVQLARWRGARVQATAGPENHAYLRELGVEDPIDYRSTDFREAVKRSGPDPLDVVFDTVGDGALARSVEVMRPGGRAVSIVDRKGVEDLREQGRETHYVFVAPRGDQLAELTHLIEAGDVKPTIQEILPLDEAARAHEISEGGHVRGKLVLQVP